MNYNKTIILPTHKFNYYMIHVVYNKVMKKKINNFDKNFNTIYNMIYAKLLIVNQIHQKNRYTNIIIQFKKINKVLAREYV